MDKQRVQEPSPKRNGARGECGPRRMDADALDRLLAGLRESGYRLIGPTVQDGAVVYDEIGGIADLPEGVGD